MSTLRDDKSPSTPFRCAYDGRRAVLATMHGKERAIARAFHEKLGLTVEVARGIDTDTLGTFTGEIGRAGTMREAAIAKARLGMSATGVPIGIASEGSYGPHPSLPFIPGGIELMVLVDDAHGIIVSEHLVDDAPVYGHAVGASIESMAGFLGSIRFPEHAVIVHPNGSGPDAKEVFKGVCTDEALADAISLSAMRSVDGKAFVQTDMRAHMNPTRMNALTRLASRLCDRLLSPCPECQMPGYGHIDSAAGLPCKNCGTASVLIQHFIFGCVACGHREALPRPDGRTYADSEHCPECNP